MTVLHVGGAACTRRMTVLHVGGVHNGVLRKELKSHTTALACARARYRNACALHHGHSKPLLMSLSAKESMSMVFPGEGNRYITLWRG